MKKMITSTALICWFILYLSAEINAQVINVPQDFPTIQGAIDVSQSGDTILVANGEYFENINFRNKNIVVCSNYVYGHNNEDIYNTIINGSVPVHPDTASCVIIAGSQDSTTVIQGFTLTGGMGTLWEDEHSPGSFYTEGGGILIQYSAPSIKNNIITGNFATNVPSGAVSAGGGAIRCGDGNPHLYNNIISHNQGKYGAGLVLNYSGAVIKNNVFAFNTGGQSYGGGGLWCLSNGSAPIIIVNNTIVMNHSALGGGGIRLWSSAAQITNNIIWGNTATTNPQIQGYGGTVTYCCIEGGWTGEGNIDQDPELTDNLFIPGINSPCIDHGDSSEFYNDPEDPANQGFALYPAQGGLMNDIGAYGGPFCLSLPEILTLVSEDTFQNEIRLQVFPNPVTQERLFVEITGQCSHDGYQIILSEITGKVIHGFLMPSNQKMQDIPVEGLTNGIYVLIVLSQNRVMGSKKLVILRNTD